MTFDIQVATTWESAFQDFRDKVSGMTGWSVVDDALSSSGYFVVEAPQFTGFNTAEPHPDQFKVGSSVLGSNPSKHLAYDYGDVWDTQNTSFAHSFTSGDGDISNQAPNPTDDVEYWLQYDPDYGFVFYIRRVQGDGNDGAAFVGYTRMDPSATYWDYLGSDSWPPSYQDTQDYPDGFFNAGQVAAGAVTNTSNMMTDPENAKSDQWYGVFPANTQLYQDRDFTQGAGMLNPDANFTNYIWQRTVVQSYGVRNSESNKTPPIGELYQTYIKDESRSDLNTGDVIQDAGGADEWMIVDYHGLRVAIRAT